MNVGSRQTALRGGPAQRQRADAVPTDTMPSVLRPVALHQPLTPIIETVRGLLVGTPIGDNATLAVTWCAAILLGSFLLATWLFRRRTAA